jgi:hypothetical protein
MLLRHAPRSTHARLPRVALDDDRAAVEEVAGGSFDHRGREFRQQFLHALDPYRHVAHGLSLTQETPPRLPWWRKVAAKESVVAFARCRFN